MMGKLTDKQEMFCVEYLIDLNATQAAIRAGYSTKTAQAIGAENLTKPLIAEKIAKSFNERIESTKIDAAYVLLKSNELLERCMADGEEFNAAGAGKALDLIGKHIDVQAFNDKATVETVVKVKSFTDMYGDA